MLKRNDISGDSVTVDFQRIKSIAGIAVAMLRDEVYQSQNEIRNHLDSKNWLRAELESKRLESSVKQYNEALALYRQLSALDEGKREKLYIYNLTQEAVTIE